LALNNRRRVDVYFSHQAGERIVQSFTYCFTAAPGSGYPPILNQHLIAPGRPVTIAGPGGDIELLPFLQEHGEITSLGFRVGSFAYSCDLSGIPEESALAVSGLDVWILDALRPAPHPSQLSLSEALEHVARYQPRQAILTNLHIDLDYVKTDRATPENVRPAFDGLRIDVSAGEILGSR
jgi:phosphoribosyl 1,2-cyclic phosphate phosphodiesterase